MSRKLFFLFGIVALLIFWIIETTTLPLEYGPVYYKIGLNSETKKSWKKARYYYEKAAEADPQMAEPHYQLGKLCQDQWNHAQAIVHFQDAIYRHSGYHQAYYAAAFSYFEKGHCHQALHALEKAFQAYQYHYRKVSEYYRLLSRVYSCLGEEALALTVYNEFLALGGLEEAEPLSND